MDTELVDTLVLQLNRIYPQILSDKEAHRVTTDNIRPKKTSCFPSLERAKLNLNSGCQFLQWFNSACVSLQFRNLSVPTKERLAELLKHLHGKGEEACHEFYRGLHIHAEDVYSSLPTRVIQRGERFQWRKISKYWNTADGWEHPLLKDVAPTDSHLNIFARNLVQKSIHKCNPYFSLSCKTL